MHAKNPDICDLLVVADRTTRLIAPLWPLAASVAVNPYLGHAHESMATAATRLGRAAGIQLTMQRAFYHAKFLAGEILPADVATALAYSTEAPQDLSASEVISALTHSCDPISSLPCVAQLAAAATGIDWPALISDRVGAWAGGFFDEGQAMWPASTAAGAFASWRSFASRDLSPEIAGLTGFGAHVARSPGSAHEAIRYACHALGIGSAEAETYFLGRLYDLGGWAQLARYRQWQAELDGAKDVTVVDLLAIALTCEAGVLAAFAKPIGTAWEQARTAYAAPTTPSRDTIVDCVLQDAFDRASQRRLLRQIQGGSITGGLPSVQAVFCIDVRSERYRRVLETLDPSIETLGFAGFFGLGLAHRRFGSSVTEARLPVLLKPALSSFVCDGPASEEKHRIASRTRRAWGRFKLAAVSSFAFVEASGPTYVAKLVKDAFSRQHRPAHPEPAPTLSTALSLDEKAAAAISILRAMSLTDDFAPIVLLVGHGASVVNNAHAGSLQCGACGGYAGDVNARLVAALLNDSKVRARVSEMGIEIPQTTRFVGALHDTVSDEVTLFDEYDGARGKAEGLETLRKTLGEAAALARVARAPLLPGATSSESVLTRAADWAQVRPEWGLAGCRAFVAASRQRTRHLDLGGQVFLHSYEWTRDEQFATLELILTAPVVVASWINLQYYGSVVSPRAFGAGDKLIHNVVGGVGVLEGQGGPLRGGLPWQSVHDGKALVHEPLRLTVIVEAPREAVASILERHPEVGALFDNGWLSLYVVSEHGFVSHRYRGNGLWTETGAYFAGTPAIAA